MILCENFFEKLGTFERKIRAALLLLISSFSENIDNQTFVQFSLLLEQTPPDQESQLNMNYIFKSKYYISHFQIHRSTKEHNHSNSSIDLKHIVTLYGCLSKPNACVANSMRVVFLIRTGERTDEDSVDNVMPLF